MIRNYKMIKPSIDIIDFTGSNIKKKESCIDVFYRKNRPYKGVTLCKLEKEIFKGTHSGHLIAPRRAFISRNATKIKPKYKGIVSKKRHDRIIYK